MKTRPLGSQYLNLDNIHVPEITEEEIQRAKKYLSEHKAEDLLEVLGV